MAMYVLIFFIKILFKQKAWVNFIGGLTITFTQFVSLYFLLALIMC